MLYLYSQINKYRFNMNKNIYILKLIHKNILLISYYSLFINGTV